MNIFERYTGACNHPSDINEHLPVLRNLSEKCSHITEFGVRKPTSTYAFLVADPEYIISYDIEKHPEVDTIIHPAFKFVLGNTLEIEIEETDFLFIDTWHTYKQLSQELVLHAGKVKKYIGFHDVFSFGSMDECDYSEQPQRVYGDGPGLMKAILEFLTANPEWRVIYQTAKNNGLMIISRVHD